MLMIKMNSHGSAATNEPADRGAAHGAERGDVGNKAEGAAATVG